MTLQEVITFTRVILKQSPQEKNKSLPVITVYIVYSLVCGASAICLMYVYVIKVYFLLCVVSTAHHGFCVFCSSHGH